MTPTTSTSFPASNDPTLRDLLAPLFRHQRLLAVVFIAVLLGSGVAALLFSGQYESHMQILVNRERLDPVVSTEATETRLTSAPPPVTEEEINSEVEILQSRDLLEKVVVANGLQEKVKKSLWAMLRPKQDEGTYLSRATEQLAKKLKVSAITKTNLVQVSYSSSDPHLSYGVLNTLANAYLEKHIAVHRPSGSFDFFSKEADKYHKALADSETQLADFATQQGVVAPDIERTMLSQKLVDSLAALQEAQQAISADQQRIGNLQMQIEKTPARSSTEEISNSADVLLQQLQASLLAAQVRRSQLVLKYEPSYPLVQEADREIKQTQDAIEQAKSTRYVNQTTDRDPTYEFLRQDVAKTQADLASQKATAAALGTSIKQLRQQLVTVGQKALEHGDLLRETKANESNYLLYLSKREQERTSDALDQKRIANVAIADAPAIPALPAHSPWLFLLAGVFAATFLSVAATYVADYVDPAFRTPAEVIEILKIPVVVGVPRQRAEASR